MRIAVCIVLILIQACIIAYFVVRGSKQAAAGESKPDENTYDGIRQFAINVTAAQLKLALLPSDAFVYGVVMDWNMTTTTVTLAAYITGAANMYFSTGGGITGAGRNPEVGEAAVDFVIAAQQLVNRAVPTTTTTPPAEQVVKFLLLTNGRIYAIQEPVAYFEDGSSPWLGLFEKGNRVLVEMRKEGNGAMAN